MAVLVEVLPGAGERQYKHEGLATLLSELFVSNLDIEHAISQASLRERRGAQ